MIPAEKIDPVEITMVNGKEFPIFTNMIAGLLSIVPLVGYLFPRFLAFYPGLIGLIAFCAAWYLYKERPTIHKGSALVLFGVIALAGISSIWAIDSTEALERTLKMSLVLLPALLLLSFLHKYGKDIAPSFARYFPIVTIVAFGLAFIDLQTYGSLFSLIRGIEVDTSFNESNVNRGVIVLTLCMFPAYFALVKSAEMRSKRLQVILKSILALFAIGVFFRTDSQSAHLIFIICTAAYFLFPVTKNWAWIGLFAILSALTFTAPLLAQYMFQTLPELIGGKSWFEQSYALNRLEIWDFVSRYIETNPVYGLGIEATRYIEDFDSALLYHDKNVILHPHNFALQIWMEFGWFGPLAATVLFAYIFSALRKFSPQNARLGLIIFLSALCPAATAYGLWQGWQLGLFLIMTGYCYVLFSQQQSSDRA